ncbi:MAG: tetratricopeptide (TPR) repeat protein, partial [Gammaproteobacteria bacterium]
MDFNPSSDIQKTLLMTGKKTLFALLLCCFAFTGVQAQKLNKAQRYMDQLNYIGAIEIYNQILNKSDNAEAKINIAECYRKISDSENAEYWYGQVVRLPEAESVHRLYYGQTLQRNGKCDLAKEWYEKYINEVPDDLRGQYLVEACDYE